jgi:hypothetical protein
LDPLYSYSYLYNSRRTIHVKYISMYVLCSFLFLEKKVFGPSVLVFMGKKECCCLIGPLYWCLGESFIFVLCNKRHLLGPHFVIGLLILTF